MVVAYQIYVALIIEALLIAMSVAVAAQLNGHPKLPMQWQLDGTVTWMAPRRFALAFTPGLTLFVLGTILALSVMIEPRSAQEWLLIPVTLIVGFIFVSVHALHLWMMIKFVKR